MRLLIVEESAELAQAMTEAFGRRRVWCDWARNAADAAIMIETTAYAMVILEVNLPDEDGIALLRRWRGSRRTEPVLIVSARAEVESRIEGLTAGADDYVVKPFNFDELFARVEAVRRREAGLRERVLEAAGLALELDTRRFHVGGVDLPLSVREGELLELLMRRLDKVVPKRVLEDQLFGAGDSLGSNAVEVYVHRIRRHLSAAELPLTIRTVRGVGYMLLQP